MQSSPEQLKNGTVIGAFLISMSIRTSEVTDCTNYTEFKGLNSVVAKLTAVVQRTVVMI